MNGQHHSISLDYTQAASWPGIRHAHGRLSEHHCLMLNQHYVTHSVRSFKFTHCGWCLAMVMPPVNK